MTRMLATPSSSGAPRARGVDRYSLVLLLGYGLYRILMNLAYSSTMGMTQSPFPLNGSDIAFALVAVLSFVATSIPLAIIGAHRPQLRLEHAGLAAILILGGITLGSGLGAFDAIPSPALPILLSIIYGVTSITGNIAWLVPFAELSSKRCLLSLASAMLIGSLGTLALGALPSLPLIFTLALLSMASGTLFWLLDQVPSGNPTTLLPPLTAEGASDFPETSPSLSETWRATARLCKDLWGPFVIYASLTALSGFVTSFFASGEALSGYITSIAASLVVAILAFVSNRTIDLRSTFRAIFPCIGLLLIVLPFLGSVYSTLFCSSLQFISAVVNISFLFLLLETARIHHASTVTAIALTMFTTRLGLLASLAAGNVLGSLNTLDSVVKTFVMVAVSLYFLSMALMMVSRYRESRDEGSSVLTALGSTSPTEANRKKERPTNPKPDAAATRDNLEARSHEIAKHYHLTPREREVALLLAHGRTAAYIGSELALSTNTIRGYVQELYAKMGIHSKQELIDLFREPQA